MLTEYFQHFKLYKYCFTPTIIEHVKFDVEEIPIPVPEPEPEPAGEEGEEGKAAEEEGDADAAGAAVSDADAAAAAAAAEADAAAGAAGGDGAGGEEEEPVAEDVLAFTATVRARLEPMKVSLQRRIEKEVMEKDAAE